VPKNWWTFFERPLGQLWQLAENSGPEYQRSQIPPSRIQHWGQKTLILLSFTIGGKFHFVTALEAPQLGGGNVLVLLNAGPTG
jgi:hypothetical protein